MANDKRTKAELIDSIAALQERMRNQDNRLIEQRGAIDRLERIADQRLTENVQLKEDLARSKGYLDRILEEDRIRNSPIQTVQVQSPTHGSMRRGPRVSHNDFYTDNELGDEIPF